MLAVPSRQSPQSATMQLQAGTAPAVAAGRPRAHGSALGHPGLARPPRAPSPRLVSIGARPLPIAGPSGRGLVVAQGLFGTTTKSDPQWWKAQPELWADEIKEKEDLDQMLVSNPNRLELCTGQQ